LPWISSSGAVLQRDPGRERLRDLVVADLHPGAAQHLDALFSCARDREPVDHDMAAALQQESV
jgi:hypothetical protein